jgi:acyl carrier protein
MPRQKIRSFILSNYLFTDDESLLSDDESLMDKGAIDSTGALELISFLEEQFKIQVAHEEMIPGNLDTVSAIVAFVIRKTTSAAVA